MNRKLFSLAALFAVERPLAWIALALLIRTALFIWFAVDLQFADNNDGLWGACSGDCFSYIQPIEHLLQNGAYALYDPNTPYAGRMPGYSAIYLGLRLLLSPLAAQNTLFFLQLLLGSVSVYYLGRLAFLVVRNKLAFYICFVLYACSSFTAIFDLYLLTESFAVSTTIIAVYRTLSARNRTDFLIAGSLFAWAIFLRPFLLLFPLALILYFCPKFNRARLKTIFIFLLPLTLALSAWTMRNRLVLGEWIILQSDEYAGYDFPKQRIALYRWVQSWGGDIVWWNPNAEIMLFHRPASTTHLHRRYQNVNDLPNYIYTSVYNRDSLRALAEAYPRSLNDTMLAKRLTAQLNEYTDAFRHERPFYYYVVAPARLLVKFLGHSGTYNLSSMPFAQQNFFQRTIKIAYSALFHLVIWGGLLGICVFGWKNPVRRYVSLIALTYLFIFPLGFRMIEYRYLTVAYPFLLVGVTHLFIAARVRKMTLFSSIKKINDQSDG